MTVKELIKTLVEYDMEQEVEICCYTSIGDPDDMVIYDNYIDENGNVPCQINKEIVVVSLARDGKTVCIS